MEQFFNKIKESPALKDKYEALLKKHEASRDRDALAADLAELARTGGFDTTPEGILSAFAPKGEIGEEEMEAVSGGGSGFACCMFSTTTSLNPRNKTVRDVNSGYEASCCYAGGAFCTWVGCRCWMSKHCNDGWHKCNEDGSYIVGHGWSS